MQLDEVDKKIITLIQEHPDLTHTAIASKIGKSQPTIGLRLKKLIKSGAFKIQPGINFKNSQIYMAIVKIRTLNPELILRVSETCPFILNCFSVSGDYNLCLLIASSKLEYLDAIVNNHFRKHDDSQKVRMEVVIDIAKDFTLPIDLKEQAKHDPTNKTECVEECQYCQVQLMVNN